MGDAASPERVSWPEGWVGVTTWDDDNKVASKVYDDYRVRYPDAEAPKRELIAVCRDGLTALIEGIIQAPILTRDGIRRGLELVQMLPAASGGPRTCLGFSPHNHRGLQGPDVMVLRRMQDGQPVMEGRIQLF
jgi:ABC-type branched-subunit amino acid transport system substrate-binding protein